MKNYPNPANYPPYPVCCGKEMPLDFRPVKQFFFCLVCDRQLLVEDHYDNVAKGSDLQALRVMLECKDEELRQAAWIIAELRVALGLPATETGIADAD